MRWLDGITDSMDMNLGQTLGDGEGREAWKAAAMGSQKRVKHDLATEQQQQQQPMKAGNRVDCE